jgi:hemerythrin superfamily protein
MDAISLLRADHRRVEALFNRFERTPESDLLGRTAVVDELLRELAVHSSIEEQILYPHVRAVVADADDEVLEGLEEHRVVKRLCADLERTPPGDERYAMRVKVLRENVEHHVEEEQDELFPKVQAVFERAELEELGEELQGAKLIAPTRAHPNVPDQPPLNIIVGLMSAPLDRAVTLGRRTVVGAMTLVGEAAKKAANR